MLSSRDITVIIPSGGLREKTLHRAILSVVTQTENVAEVLVVWDGDKPPFSYIGKFGESVKVMFTPTPFSGVSVARQLGIIRAQTSLVCILDDDDYWEKTKIAEQVKLFKYHSNPDNIFSFSRSALRYENGEVKAIVPKKRYSKNVKLGSFFFSHIPIQNSRKTCSSSTYLFSRKLAIENPFRFDLISDEDTDFILRIQDCCQVFYVHKNLVHTTYRKSGGLSHSKRNLDEWFDWVESLKNTVQPRLLENIKIVYGVRHYLKQDMLTMAFRLWIKTAGNRPDLISALTGLILLAKYLITNIFFAKLLK
jgi:glycosyltransferase involved in cell wall biosynthesis